MSRAIIVTEKDLERLKKLAANEREFGKARESKELKDLQMELEHAQVVSPKHIPAGTITMNSKFLLKHLDSGEVTEYSLVYPEDADFLENKISVFFEDFADGLFCILSGPAQSRVAWPSPAWCAPVPPCKVIKTAMRHNRLTAVP